MVAALYPSIQLTAPPVASQERVLTPEAIQFLVRLSKMFERQRRGLLEARRTRQEAIDDGWRPDFRPETAEIRESFWRVRDLPADLIDRRVEIIRPPSCKTIVKGMNSGARIFVADFEDSSSPIWGNMIEGQRNLRDAVNGSIVWRSPTGRRDTLCEEPAALIVRPRGWHLVEKHFLVDGEPISAALFDFGLYFFHNVRTLTRNGTGPYFYLPKLESHLEARLWNDIFVEAQRRLGIMRGTIKAAVQIENILAAFEMNEILWELRDHSAGLACGGWDYLFSYVKTFRNHPQYLLPDLASIGMTSHFLSSYRDVMIATCHRRRAHAIGAMAAQIPTQNTELDAEVLAKLHTDQLHEVWSGHDGTQVAHPGLVPMARMVFDTYMAFPNQVERVVPFEATAADLVCTPQGAITNAGVENNVDVGLRYLAAWLGGKGCVAIHNRLEDTATAEICRGQLWQWLRHGAVKIAQVREAIGRTVEKLHGEVPERELGIAERLYVEMLDTSDFLDFLTLRAYDYIE